MGDSFFDRVHRQDTHTPDVLSCLANLSNDEVFTPPEVVNQMLDALPQELFESTETTFLDPACKTGVFLREIAKRLLNAQMPNYQDRVADLNNKKSVGVAITKEEQAYLEELQAKVDHIFHNQLFGIAITELTSLLSRRSVYCSMYPNGKYSVSKFDTAEGNIRFRRIQHTWKDGKCIYCGASEEQWARDEILETHAYEFVHMINMQEAFNMAFFDVIISNPPYQLSTGGGVDDTNAATQAKPIYNKFVEQAIKLNPRYVTMIIPARWYAGGMGLNNFRTQLLNDHRLTTLVDYINSKDCFGGVDIAGGVCYFLWERDCPTDTSCHVINISGENRTETQRYLNEFGNIFIRSNDAISIIKKVKKKTKEFWDSEVSTIDTFGIPSKEKGHPKYRKGDLKLLHSVGSNKQGEDYIAKSVVKKNHHLIDKYKIKISIMVPQNGEVGINPENGYRSISTPQILPPGEVDTFSYLNIGFFDTEEEALNFRDFMNCKFPRFMMRTTYSSVHISKSNFIFVPKLDFKKKWTDSALYEYYELSKKEIDLIEKTMRPMT